MNLLSQYICQNKHNMKDIIRVCQQGRARQVSTQRDANSPPLYPEYLLIYVVHALAHHSACPNVDECKDIREYEAIYRYSMSKFNILDGFDSHGASSEAWTPLLGCSVDVCLYQTLPS